MSHSTRMIGKVSSHELCHLHTTLKQRLGRGEATAIGLFVLYGSWNTGFDPKEAGEYVSAFASLCGQDCVAGFVQVDESEESLSACLGDNDSRHSMGPCPPSELPALAVVGQHDSMDHSICEFVAGVPPSKLMHPSATQNRSLLPQIRDAIVSVRSQITANSSTPLETQDGAIRIFVSGDKSSVGKSSICLGILASLIEMGYDPSALAYIKPATQCEAPQLIQAYCEQVGIPCVPVGPVVYFKGFTRAFLAGETDSSSELLESGGDAVDELARGKRVIMIDGVGFPSVGSICGTDNASMARACGYPVGDGNERSPVGVLIVGGSGVGAAVDAFNLNATYFKARNVPVLGGVFNKLSLEGFYSLENCREQVTRYFDQAEGDARAFGFVPLTPGIAGDIESAMDYVDEYVRIFREHVDVKGIVEAAARYAPFASKQGKLSNNGGPPMVRPTKRQKLANGVGSSRKRAMMSREAIEAKAIKAGAAPSA